MQALAEALHVYIIVISTTRLYMSVPPARLRKEIQPYYIFSKIHHSYKPVSLMPGQVKSAPSEQSIVQPFLFRQSAESVGSHTPG